MGASFLQIMLAFSKKLVYTVFVSAEFVAVTQFPTPAGVMGSEPTTASGGVKEGERVAAVDEGRRLLKAEDIRREPQQEKPYYNGAIYNTCRCDGIGRRSGLKIHRWRHRAGSSPATGTM